MDDRCEVQINQDEDMEPERNIQCNGQRLKDPDDIKELFKLLEGWNSNHEHYLKEMRRILERNRNLLTHRFNMKSIIHAAKYNSKINYSKKQEIIDTIIEIGYTLFKFSRNSTMKDNFHALFFVAARGDYQKLIEIVTYFKDYDVTKIHDTHEGDTVLSFMVKFGNYFQKGFLDCLKFMVQENIDIERVDYFNKNVSEVIRTEIDFMNKLGDTTGRIDKLNDIKEIINQFFERNEDTNSRIKIKYTLFQALIKQEKQFSELLKEGYVNLDDGENTLLQLAIIKNNIKITKELLRKGASPNHMVQGGNEEVPLVLAAKLKRADIVQEILRNKNIKITKSILSVFIREVKPKFLNYLLESEFIDVDMKYKGKIPLYYAINRKNKVAIQSLLRRGSRVNYNHLQNINPRDLEEYLNSCIKQDSFADDMEENQYKPLLIFDFFINSSEQQTKKEISPESFYEQQQLKDNNCFIEQFDTEVAIIRNLGDNKRLKHLLEHPLVHIYMILKWHCVKQYYYYLLIFKFIFCLTLDALVYNDVFSVYVAIPILAIQIVVVLCNCEEFKCNFRKYTLHFILEIFILILVCLETISAFIGRIGNKGDIMIQISAVLIIFTSLSMLLTVGYHFSLSKWMAMAKRVFKNFTVLLLFFMIPIIAFATSFKLLNSLNVETKKSENNGTNFDSLPGALYRTIVMLAGDIGDKEFIDVGDYIVFIFFTIAMAIILLNFWTGVAVSDIKKIEEQSTIIAFQNVIIFIESVERMYKFFWEKVFQNRMFPKKWKPELPFLKSKVYLKESQNRSFHYGIDIYINSRKQFKNQYFKKCKIPNYIILKIKSLFEEKDLNIRKTLKELISKVELINDMNVKLNDILQILTTNTTRKKKVI